MKKKIFLRCQRLIVRGSLMLLMVIFLSPAMVFAQATFEVVHPTIAPTENNNFIVSVKTGPTTTLAGAMVTLSKDGWSYSKLTGAYGREKGTARFFYSLSPGTMTIRVTKDGYREYQGTCTLVSCAGTLWVSLHGGGTRAYEEWYKGTICFNWIVNLEYRWPRFAVVLDVAYNDFKQQEEHFHWWNISPSVRYYVSKAKFKPFINLAPGFYIPKEGKGRFGIKAGIGFDYQINDRLYFEMGTDYHYIFSNDEESTGALLNNARKTAFQHFHAGVVIRLK